MIVPGVIKIFWEVTKRFLPKSAVSILAAVLAVSTYLIGYVDAKHKEVRKEITTTEVGIKQEIRHMTQLQDEKMSAIKDLLSQQIQTMRDMRKQIFDLANKTK